MKIQIATVTRNRKGNASSNAAMLEADMFKIGRGADCKIHLADPRVALYHAAIRRDDKGEIVMVAAVGTLTINGSTESAISLKSGQHISLGPYEIIIDEAKSGMDLAMTLECILPLEAIAESTAETIPHDLANTSLSKRKTAWILGLGMLTAFLLWPVLSHISGNPESGNSAQQSRFTADAAWDVGTLASGHHSFGKQCDKCHEQPFTAVRNEACEACHKNVGWHFPLTTQAAQKMHNTVFVESGNSRCASCHRDHKGLGALQRIDSPLCTNCHANLKSRVNETTLPDISDFSKNHPAFRLTMVNAVSKKIERNTDATVAIKEKSGLKFPHDVHLLQKGVRGPNGKVVMECRNCHVADELGLRFKSINMKQHCADCHSLEFEPAVTTRQVPHGNVDDVVNALNEFYAGAALSDSPIDVITIDGIQRRPGERPSESQRGRASIWAKNKAAVIAKDLFEVRTCVLCHEVSHEQSTWAVAPVAITQNWLPHAGFRHDKHSSAACETCHQVTQSKTSADVAIPDIKICRDCHGGNTSVVGKAPGTCETCHGFHSGKASTVVMDALPVSTFKPIGKSGQ